MICSVKPAMASVTLSAVQVTTGSSELIILIRSLVVVLLKVRTSAIGFILLEV